MNAEVLLGSGYEEGEGGDGYSVCHDLIEMSVVGALHEGKGGSTCPRRLGGRAVWAVGW